MEFIIKTMNCRQEDHDLHIEVPFANFIVGINEFTGSILLMDDNGKNIAFMQGLFFNENKLCYVTDGIVEAADCYSLDAFKAIDKLVKSKPYKQRQVKPAEYGQHTLYIERFYVYPEFRNQGYGNWLLQNLDDLVEYYFNVSLYFAVTMLVPQEPIGSDDTHKDIDYFDWKDNDAPEMNELLKKTFVDAGFKRLGRSDIYALEFSKEQKN